MWKLLVIAMVTGMLQLSWTRFGIGLVIEPTLKSYYYIVIPCLWASFWSSVESFCFVKGTMVCLSFLYWIFGWLRNPYSL